ncbi:MAG: hypothetical protein RLZZ369_716 [Pseudomonadota bacterium]|jgi:hypothetical protein
MSITRSVIAILASSVLPIVLVACGGGAGGNTANPDFVNNTTPPITNVDPSGAWPPAAQASPATSCSTALTGSHQTYDVGPGKTYTELTDVPWLSLQAGDVVNIYYRATPYRTKFGLRAQGTETDPVVINGVTDGSCNRPEISGNSAITATDARNANYGDAIQPYALISIYRGSSDAWDTYTPKHITIQNLKLTGAKVGTSFTSNNGSTRTYDNFAAAIYAVRVHNLTIENCEITGNGVGVFTNTKGSSADDYSANVIIRRNRIHLNGNIGRQTEHNLYVQARRVLYEGNYIGQAYGGSSLKDRSSGTVIRYNKILASARALDLVETEEETFTNLQQDPLYPYAWVYGNIIVNDYQAPAGYAVNMIHWGFDNTQAQARTGTLFFYANTLVNNVPQNTFWYVSPFQIGQDGLAAASTTVESASNIFWQQSDSEWRFLSANAGVLDFKGTNYVPTGWYGTNPSLTADVRTVGATLLTGTNPLLTAAFAPQTGSPALNRGGTGPSSTPEGATANNLLVTHQYAEGVGIIARPTQGVAADLGALELP